MTFSEVSKYLTYFLVSNGNLLIDNYLWVRLSPGNVVGSLGW